MERDPSLSLNSIDRQIIDPMDGLLVWLKEAETAKIPEHVAMTLSTVSTTGQPSSRIVYFKGFSKNGGGLRCPRFFTNYESQKSKEIETNPQISLLFYWPTQWRQIRIEGQAERVSVEESEEYFQSRARGSRVGAWASPQSDPIKGREDLEARVLEIEAKFEGKDSPCPPFWGGWRVDPRRVEFWQGGTHRLHDRRVFTKIKTNWVKSTLAP
jgi:pyridoxamine 5'-phosphate oxidase